MTVERIAFEVRGNPVSEGSTRVWMVKGKPITTHGSKGLGAWRRVVADMAQQYAPDEPWDGPVAVVLLFTRSRPKSEPKRRRTWPDRKPDLDKWIRAVLDALTGVIFNDDGQVVEIRATKEWGAPGVTVVVERVDANTPTLHETLRFTKRSLSEVP